MKTHLKKCLPVNAKTTIRYEGTKLSTQFPVKDKIIEDHHDLFYFSKCPDFNCKEKHV